jgi:hypothetical protein
VVIYTVEGVGGGNGWTQYATVLTGSAAQFAATPPVEVGAKGKRAVEGCSIAPQMLELAAKEWAPADAACCPSRPVSSRYDFTKGALVAAPSPSPSGS